MATTKTLHPVYRRRRRIFLAVFALVVIAALGVGGYLMYSRQGATVKDFEGQGTGESVFIQVEKGDSVDSLSAELVEKGIVASRGALMQKAAEINPSLHPGHYALKQEMSSEAALKTLSDQSARRGVVDIPNGTTLQDVKVVGGATRPGIYSLVAAQTCDPENKCVSAAELQTVAANEDPAALAVPAWAVAKVQAHRGDAKRLEGLIAPGIHFFDPSESPVEILKTLLSSSQVTYEQTNLLAMANSVRLSPYDLLTAASLVEREAPENDFAKVARVILNRLAKNMPLQFDSTVNYAIPEVEVATTNADRRRETPWNTYAKKGLPETPIASPGLKAVQAMENPAPGDWLYFVTIDKDGTTVFNADFAKHEEAIEISRANGVLDSRR